MGDVSDARCCNCEIPAARLDERGWCEQCWIERGASHQLFHDLEELVKQSLDTGVLTPAQLQEALRMSLANVDGPLPGTGFRRESVETEERGVWEVPSSAFDHEAGVQRRRNRIALLRTMTRLSLEAVAEKIGVAVEEVALWEQDVLPAEEHAAAAASMCALFEVSPEFVFGLESGEVA
jgi:DNA-binding XRE family transcriptional regulator